MTKPTLLVLAAGMGSRYGGLKQIDPVGPSGETIIDYSIYDAIQAGFGKVVFVIRQEIKESFQKVVGQKFEKRIPVDYVFQELTMLPPGFQLPSGRTKPWGTAHAILVAEKAIQEPFAVINGDDFYGSQSFRSMADYLRTSKDSHIAEYCMVGFILRNTLSDFGSVARGVCHCDSEGFLKNVVEHTKIEKTESGAKHVEDGTVHTFTGDESVSMNLWGFTPSIFEHLHRQFAEFLKTQASNLKAEFFIPTVVNQLIVEQKARTKVLRSNDRWFGITYQDDRPFVAKSILDLVKKGNYPNQLWA
jgi:UTP-glucose-1-phosphate uridylyltransferase